MVSAATQKQMDALYATLKNKTFQQPQTGNLSIPFYLYCYDAAKEYEVQEAIHHMTSRLHRPDNFLDIPVVNIFQLFIAYLKSITLGPDSLYESILRTERESEEDALDFLTEEANSDAFLEFAAGAISDQFTAPNPQPEAHAYVFLTGWGQIFPYLRSSSFLNYLERHNRSAYKLIIFYPGKADHFCRLFDLLEDRHPYRVIVLNPSETSSPHAY